MTAPTEGRRRAGGPTPPIRRSGLAAVLAEQDRLSRAPRALVTIDMALSALAEANTPDELVDLADKAEAMRAYAKRARLGLAAQNRCAALRLRAERKLGLLLAAMMPPRGRPKKGREEDHFRAQPRLVDLGVDKHIALRARRLMQVPEPDFEGYLSAADGTETTLAGLLAAATPPGEVGAHDLGDVLADEQVTEPGHCEWRTPPYVIEAMELKIGTDPASPGRDKVPWIRARVVYTIADDGLTREWFGLVWLNAPFGTLVLPAWLEKFARHGNGVALVPDQSSAAWWQRLVSGADLALAVNHRIRFIGPNGEERQTFPRGTTLVAYGEEAVQGLVRAAERGLGVLMTPGCHLRDLRSSQRL